MEDTEDTCEVCDYFEPLDPPTTSPSYLDGDGFCFLHLSSNTQGYGLNKTMACSRTKQCALYQALCKLSNIKPVVLEE